MRYPISLLILPAVVLAACAPIDPGVPGSSAVTHPKVDGTVFTIVFENENENDVIVPSNPNFYALAQSEGTAAAYISSTHPSLPNYIMMTSGATNGITNDNDPGDNTPIAGHANVADQLDAAGIPWRGYMESMGDPCGMVSTDLYAAHHDPFVYYATMSSDAARCDQHIVDYDANFDHDLASGAYRYMWVTPNMCDDMHNCSSSDADAWLGTIIPKIQASDAYKKGGAIFILFDEGYLRFAGGGADLPTIVASPNLVSPGYVAETTFDHRSYLATVEDIFGMPRLSTTVDAVPMSEFFLSR